YAEINEEREDQTPVLAPLEYTAVT
ncbi:MAG: hypothetical protein ACJA1M_001330, partial [Alphaproteobacteria bacterium]